MVYLVTGCAGFIGSHLARKIISRGDYVVGIDNRPDLYRIYDLLGNPNFSFFDWDINYDLVPLLGRLNFDRVYHLAARTGVRESIECPNDYFKTNLFGTLNVLNVMRKTGCKKLTFASTSSVYAGETIPYKETQHASTLISPYAASKKAAEEVIHSFYACYGIEATVFRYFTVYGPQGRKDMAPYRIIDSAIKDKPFVVYGDGKQARDWTYIDDIVGGTFIGEDIPGFKIINLGRGQSVSLSKIIGMVEKITGKKIRVEYQDKAKGDVNETLACIDRAKILGWAPSVSVYEGLKRAVNSHE